MRGIAICLVVIAFALPVQARGVRLSAADAGCPDDDKAVVETKPAARARATPARDGAKSKPTEHGDAIEGGRLQSPRWHSFLPGMIR